MSHGVQSKNHRALTWKTREMWDVLVPDFPKLSQEGVLERRFSDKEDRKDVNTYQDRCYFSSVWQVPGSGQK